MTRAFTEIERGTDSPDDVDITEIGDGYQKFQAMIGTRLGPSGGGDGRTVQVPIMYQDEAVTLISIAHP